MSPPPKPIDGHTKLLALFGKELGYSASPALHNRWLQHAGCNAVYVPLAFPSSQMFLQALHALVGCPHFLGGNITNPFKAVLHHDPVFTPDERVRALGASNTIYRSSGQWLLTNTDVDGVHQTLKLWPALQQSPRLRVILLGAGGAAAAVAFSLLQCFGSRERLRITVLTRSTATAHSYLRSPDLGADLNESPMDGRDCGTLTALAPMLSGMPSDWSTSPVLLVSALPIGQHGESNPCAEMLIETVLAPLGQGGHYFDLTYGSGKAVELAKAKGIRHQDGRVMLEAQAHKSFQLWKTELERFSPSETP